MPIERHSPTAADIQLYEGRWTFPKAVEFMASVGFVPAQIHPSLMIQKTGNPLLRLTAFSADAEGGREEKAKILIRQARPINIKDELSNDNHVNFKKAGKKAVLENGSGDSAPPAYSRTVSRLSKD